MICGGAGTSRERFAVQGVLWSICDRGAATCVVYSGRYVGLRVMEDWQEDGITSAAFWRRDCERQPPTDVPGPLLAA